MNLHRYKTKFSLRSSGDTKFEVLGTWLGFGGMLTFIIDVALFSSAREAAAIASIAVFSSFFVYWLATQHSKVIYAFLTLNMLVVSLLIIIVINEFHFRNNVEPVINLYLCYFSASSIIACRCIQRFKHGRT